MFQRSSGLASGRLARGGRSVGFGGGGSQACRLQKLESEPGGVRNGKLGSQRQSGTPGKTAWDFKFQV